ncbi:hypothetical protein K8R04_01475 [Candidatus Uhrbacteria bacterium]|nr:hypothetical protein [Candidatus Uhrbacteria bacterium]
MRRRAAVLTTTTLVGIVGFTLLQPHVPGSVLQKNHVSVEVLGAGDDRQVVVETQYLRHETRNLKADIAPDSAGWLAVWQGLTDKGWQIFLFDGKTSKEIALTDALGDHIDVHTDGRYVVWQGKDEGAWNVYRYDTERPEEGAVKISTATPATHPRISKGVTVWQQWVGGNWEVFKQEAGEASEQLTFNDLPDIQPNIFHSLVAWTEVNPGPHTRVHLQNLRTGNKDELIDNTDGQIRPEFRADGTLEWFNYGEDGYSKQGYNFLTDNLEQRMIKAIPVPEVPAPVELVPKSPAPEVPAETSVPAEPTPEAPPAPEAPVPETPPPSDEPPPLIP